MKMMTVLEAAKILKVTPQTIHIAIRKGKILAKPRKHRREKYEIDPESLHSYPEKKYNLMWREDENGVKLYGEDKINPPKLAKLCSVPVQMVYYLLRKGTISYIRKGASYVISLKEGEKAVKDHLASLSIYGGA